MTALVDLVDSEDEWDSDLYDAEILVERSGLGQFTDDDVALLFRRSRSWVYRQRTKGRLPAPQYPGEMGPTGCRARWTRDQMVVAMAEFLRRRAERERQRRLRDEGAA